MQNADAIFEFDERDSDSPFVERIWHTQYEGMGGQFISIAQTHLELVITQENGQISLTVRGPETQATPAPIPESAEFLGIMLKMGTFMPHLPNNHLVNGWLNLPQAGEKSFWLQGSAWEFPNYDNADVFVNRLVREGLLVHEPLVEATLQGHVRDMSLRSVQRRFLRATGLTHGAVYQIKRAKHALALLENGASILDTVEKLGYADQPHLTRSLKRFMGQTPAQISRVTYAK
jgi:AraC-like DNA-binding protein